MSDFTRMSHDDIKRHAEQHWEGFYRELRRVLSQFDPLQWASFISRRYRECYKKHEWFAYTPQFRMIHSVEACIAYSSPRAARAIGARELAEVMNIYHDAMEDPLLLSLAAKDLCGFGEVLFRQQLELQQSHNHEMIARSWAIFGDSAHMPVLSQLLKEKRGLTPRQWVQCCYAVFAAAMNENLGRIYRPAIEEYANRQLGCNSLDGFLDASSLTPEEIRASYKRARDKEPRVFHGMIRSVFLEKPIINWGQGRYQVPDPNLLFRHCESGLYRELKNLGEEPFGDEFGPAVEAYTGRVLESLKQKIRILSGSELQRLKSAKACDYLVEMPDCILLVEVKATTMQKRIVLPKYLKDDGSTRSLVKGMQQLGQTYLDIKSGIFAPLLLDAAKPVFGIVATFGSIPFVNSEDYYNSVIFARAAESLTPAPAPDFGMASRPVVLSLEVLELLVMLTNSGNVGLAEQFAARGAADCAAMGDWEQSLKGIIMRSGQVPERLTFHMKCVDDYYRSMGVADDRRERIDN